MIAVAVSRYFTRLSRKSGSGCAIARILTKASQPSLPLQFPTRMNVSIEERTPVDLELRIDVPAEEMTQRVDKALRERRKSVDLKGFRRGRVPLKMVQRLFGGEVLENVATTLIDEVWKDEVMDDPSRQVLGSPLATELTFDFDAPLKAVLQFSVRPEFSLPETSDVEVKRAIQTVTEEQVEDEIARRLKRSAPLVDSEGDVAVDSIVVADIQELSLEDNSPIESNRGEGQEIDLGQEDIRQEFLDALPGKKIGDQVIIDLGHEEGHDEHEGSHVHRYEVTITEIKQREEVELTEEFVDTQTAGNLKTVEEYREMIRKELESAARQVGEDVLQSEIVKALTERFEGPVPESLVDSVVSDMIQQEQKRSGATITREEIEDVAVDRAKWMLMADRAMEELEITLTDADWDEEFERFADNGPGSADMVRQFLQSQPQLMDNIRERIVNRKLFTALAERFTVVEVPFEEMDEE